ncbi:MAG: DUF624 domain-containing protein [Lachnospiraceae bacterium]|nr:DUF624 domain-containing protein [Lachnospiraceae bacterium]
MDFLKYDGKFNKFMTGFVDFLILNIFFLICCIPIITIGPALNGMYTVLFKEVRNEHSPFIKTFKKGFFEDTKKSIIIFLIYLILGFILSFSLIFWATLGTLVSTVITVIIGILCIIYLLSLCYVFALNSRFENKVLVTIKNSILLSLANPLRSIFMLLIIAIVICMGYFVPLFRLLIPLIGFSYILYCHVYIIEKVFLKLPGYEEAEKDDKTP